MLSLALASTMLRPALDWPQTRAERTNYTETSHYDDVVEFVRQLQLKGAPIQLQWMGKSTEGKPMPLVIASRPMMTPEMARRSGRIIIYIQANIHAGEVEGKEAALVLLREWSRSPNTVLDKAVVLMTPIYNIDGNEKFGPVEKNRPEQDGPALVGVRPNGQNFDLNRDCIKAESPEMQGVLKYVYKGWDPDVVMDLHTTDGTRHGFELTYSPGLNPNTDPAVMRYTRDELLPDVRKTVRRKYGIEMFDYGNLEKRAGKSAWYSFEPFGRYVTNYAGMRNRIAVLSEATTFIPFKARVVATEEFVTEVAGHVLKNAKRVMEMTRAADMAAYSLAGKQLGVRFDFDQRAPEDVPIEKLAPGEKAPLSGRPKMLERLHVEVYDRFKSTKTAIVPFAYIIPKSEAAAVSLLQKHGIIIERLTQRTKSLATFFTIGSFNQAAQAFQGHKLIRLEGTFADNQAELQSGDFIVKTAQPLGALAFYMLEPECYDGVAAWGLLSADLKAGSRYPIIKLMKPVSVQSETVGDE